jgi:hypothetical protein
MGCGGGAGVSAAFSDSPLVQDGVFELREEFLRDIPFDFTGGGWGTDEEFDLYTRLQVSALALQTCDSEGAVPVTDDLRSQTPMTYVVGAHATRDARLQAVALALSSIKLALPAIAPDLRDEEILEARDRLRDQLGPFRAAMLRLAPLVRDRISDNDRFDELLAEAKFVADTRVLPTLVEVQRRLERERGRFWRRILMKAGPLLPQFVLSWSSTSAVSAAVAAIQQAAGIATDRINHEAVLVSLLELGGVGFLLAVPDELKATAIKK